MQTDSKSTDSKVIEFDLPEGVQLPEDGSKPFDIVCTLEVTGQGRRVCMVKVGDADAPGYKDGEKQSSYSKESKPSYGDYAESIAAENPAGSSGQAGAGGY